MKEQQSRVQTAVDYVVQKEIQPFIPPQQAIAFGLQTLDLPLEGPRTDPLDFYSVGRGIVLPVRTLLFIEDLSRAYGWMWSNHFSTRTIDEYLSMLRYRSASDFPGGKYPPPLIALHIPEDALKDPKVVEASIRLRRTADAFMILHQYAHLQLRHSEGKNSAYSATDEEAADQFALDIMKENSTTPVGLFLVMYSSMLFETGTGMAIHPVTTQRLEAMAHFLDAHITEFVRGRSDKTTAMDGIHSIAKLLVEACNWWSVNGHREEVQQVAQKTDASTLEPRPLPRNTR